MNETPAPIRALYAEDTAADCELLHLVCEREGLAVDWWTVGTCSELATAIADCTHAQPDCAILDLRLPDGLATDLLPALVEHYPQLPTVVFSTSADPYDRARVEPFPGVRYLVKPATLAGYAEIVDWIRAVAGATSPR